MDRRIIDHCRKHKIRWEYEGPDEVEFRAPRGKRFGNDSRTRIIDLEMNRNIEDLLFRLTYN